MVPQTLLVTEFSKARQCVVLPLLAVDVFFCRPFRGCRFPLLWAGVRELVFPMTFLSEPSFFAL